jgi:hypothetical protein
MSLICNAWHFRFLVEPRKSISFGLPIPEIPNANFWDQRLGRNYRVKTKRGRGPHLPIGTSWGQIPQTRVSGRLPKALPLVGAWGDDPGLISPMQRLFLNTSQAGH